MRDRVTLVALLALLLMPLGADPAELKQSTPSARMFLMVQSADHITGLTGATVTCTLSKAGAAFGASAGATAEVSSGWYKLSLTTGDTNTLGDLAYHCTAASGDPT